MAGRREAAADGSFPSGTTYFTEARSSGVVVSTNFRWEGVTVDTDLHTLAEAEAGIVADDGFTYFADGTSFFVSSSGLTTFYPIRRERTTAPASWDFDPQTAGAVVYTGEITGEAFAENIGADAALNAISTAITAMWPGITPVSYTHLTLPTIYSV